MNTVLRPVGPQPARVYWARRLVVLGALLIVVVVAASLVARGAARTSGTGEVTAAGDDAAPGGEEPAVDADGEAAGTGAPVTCSAQHLTVTLTTDAPSYGPDQNPTFTVAFTNTGEETCVIDAGAANQALVVTSGSDRIWSSADCPVEGETRTLLLAPGAQDADVVPWPRVRSDETCSQDLPAPRPGTYSAVALLGGAQSGSSVFDLG